LRRHLCHSLRCSPFVIHRHSRFIIPSEFSMRSFIVMSLLLISFLFCSAALALENDDILLADFEQETYGEWTTTGTAFGKGPARGTLDGQMAVTGFRGERLVNSFAGGDRSTGTLTSPEFKIERDYLVFLIGGGGYADKTCLNLLVDGRRVRTATGPNTESGGSEELAPMYWDVSEFRGRTGQIVIVDDATGGWGHINVDHLVLTDKKPDIKRLLPAARELVADERYLLLPIRTGSPQHPGKTVRMRVSVGERAREQVVREFDLELSEEPEWFAHLDVSKWKGEKLTLHVDRLLEGSKALELVKTSSTIWQTDELYREPLRPQIHFSAKRGWLNDPNGMVFANGEYHLFFQHNPYGWHWGNMHWGHATSRDLVHWKERPIALYPRQHGDWAFSGSAVVDRENTSGWKKGEGDLMVLAYTSTGRGECMAWSNDNGVTWQEYEGNPVVKHQGRDPRLLWHEPSRRWVMAVYQEDEGKQWIAFYNSPDLKRWDFQSRIDGFFECPDLFELPVDGNPRNTKWVLTAANSDYMLGQFDGSKFTPDSPKIKGHQGKGFYAAQTFSHDPRGRIVQIGWFQAPSPEMPFNQAMSLPLELSLNSTKEGPRLAWRPVEELAKLREKSWKLGPRVVGEKENPLEKVDAEILEIDAEFTPGDAKQVRLRVRGIEIEYDVAKQTVTVAGQPASAPLTEGRQQLRLFLDRTGLELFTSQGRTFVPLPVIPMPNDRSASLEALGGQAEFTRLDVHRFGSVWAEGKR
jgi:fructan beta-fructosidase